jgi:hypothetical protein
VKLSASTKWIVSLEIDPNTSTGTLILQERSKSGLAIVLTAKISAVRTLMTVGPNPLYKAENRGEGVAANATVHLLYSDDRKPTGPQPAGGLAV